MIDLGDPVVLTFTVTDTTGAPANATSVTITVTLPDGSTSAVTTTNPTTGTYTGTYVTTQAGHHKVSCVATGTNASSQADVFDVEPLDPGLLIGLSEARKAIGQSAANAKDEDLRTYVRAVTLIVEDLAGPMLKVTGKQWTSDGGGPVVLPSAVTSVTSVTESGVALVANTDYTVNLRAGTLWRGTAASPSDFKDGTQNVVVTYTVGNAVIPANVRLAARLILRQLWIADQQGRPPAAGGAGSDTVTTPSGYAIPQRAFELLRPTQNVPGFA